MERTGKCLCEAVTFVAHGVKPTVGACHCGMCRRWAGGPWLGVESKSIDWSGEGAIGVFTSSSWAERGFCTKCGTGLFYRVTAPGPHHGATVVSLGSFDDQTGLAVTKEWFIDKKPDAYTLAGDHETMTEAEVFAQFGGS